MAQEANFFRRRTNFLASLEELRRLRPLEDAQQDLDEDLSVADAVQQFTEVNHDGNCPVCWLRIPDTILNRGHIFCLQCVQIIEASGVRTCPGAAHDSTITGMFTQMILMLPIFCWVSLTN